MKIALSHGDDSTDLAVRGMAMDEVKHNPTETPPKPASRTALAARPPAAVPRPHRRKCFTSMPGGSTTWRGAVASDTDAEDVTQDVLLQVVRKLSSFRGDSAFTTWLHRITVNAALAQRQRRAVQQKHRDTTRTLDMVLEEEPPHGPVRRWSVDPEEAALDRETQEVIERAIAALPEDYRDIILLSDAEGLPNAAIGEMLGLGLAAVSSRLHRARQKLREALAPHSRRYRHDLLPRAGGVFGRLRL